MRFGYTPFGKSHHDRRLEHAVLATATAIAEASGYERRSVWTLNRIGSAPYTSITRRRFLGMGAGSASFAGRGFFVNHFGVETYIADVVGGRVPIARRLHLARWAGAAYDAFWQAYDGGLDFGLLRDSYGGAISAARKGLALPPLITGAAMRRGEGIRLTWRGFDGYHDLERLVIYHFIEPLWAEMLAEYKARRGGLVHRRTPFGEAPVLRSKEPFERATAVCTMCHGSGPASEPQPCRGVVPSLARGRLRIASPRGAAQVGTARLPAHRRISRATPKRSGSTCRLRRARGPDLWPEYPR